MGFAVCVPDSEDSNESQCEAMRGPLYALHTFEFHTLEFHTLELHTLAPYTQVHTLP